MSVKSIFKTSSILATVLFVLAFFLSVSLFRNLLRVRQVNNSLSQSKVILSQLEQENAKLERQLESIKTDAYSEKEARDKLNLAKEGEIVLVLPEEDVLRSLSPRRREEKEHTLPDPNWKKWLNLFI